MTRHAARLKGLYVITDHDLFASLNKEISDLVAAAITGGARIVQYRDKESSYATRLAEARALKQLCTQHNVTFLINDDINLAIDSDADGVHLGQTDIPLAAARERLGKERIIGITCHNNLVLAEQAWQGGADYIAFGRFFPSRTKPDAPPATMDILVEASKLSLPVVAIGGITAANAQPLIFNGADMLAVSHSVFAAGDIIRAAQQVSQLFGE